MKNFLLGDLRGLTVKLSCRRMDAGWVSDFHGKDPQFVVAALSESAQLGSGCWITTSCVDPPSISEILTSQLKPESSIGTRD
jgi:hypothetical protein